MSWPCYVICSCSLVQYFHVLFSSFRDICKKHLLFHPTLKYWTYLHFILETLFEGLNKLRAWAYAYPLFGIRQSSIIFTILILLFFQFASIGGLLSRAKRTRDAEAEAKSHILHFCKFGRSMFLANTLSKAEMSGRIYWLRLYISRSSYIGRWHSRHCRKLIYLNYGQNGIGRGGGAHSGIFGYLGRTTSVNPSLVKIQVLCTV